MIAGFVALASSTIGELKFGRFLELRRGSVVSLASISDAPQHSGSSRFIVQDVRLLVEKSSHVERMVTRSYGAGPRETRWWMQVTPLVSSQWKPDQPVRAWLGKMTRPGGAREVLPKDGPVHLVRVAEYDESFFRRAIDAARPLASLPNAPVLELSHDATEAPKRNLMAVGIVVLAGYAVWVAGCVWARRRRG